MDNDTLQLLHGIDDPLIILLILIIQLLIVVKEIYSRVSSHIRKKKRGLYNYHVNHAPFCTLNVDCQPKILLRQFNTHKDSLNEFKYLNVAVDALSLDKTRFYSLLFSSIDHVATFNRNVNKLELSNFEHCLLYTDKLTHQVIIFICYYGKKLHFEVNNMVMHEGEI